MKVKRSRPCEKEHRAAIAVEALSLFSCRAPRRKASAHKGSTADSTPKASTHKGSTQKGSTADSSPKGSTHKRSTAHSSFYSTGC